MTDRKILHIHAWSPPHRVESILDTTTRVWAEATEPHETIEDVVRHQARQLLAVGIDPETPVRVWPRWEPQWPEKPLREYAADE